MGTPFDDLPPGVGGVGARAGYQSRRGRGRGRQCPDARPLLVGTCGHGAQRWLVLPCKRRECEVCGPRGRAAIAKRITHGVRKFQQAGAMVAWLVLTFTYDPDRDDAGRQLGELVRWLRDRTGRPLEYAATFEDTRKGRLHINLLVAPWKWLDQAELESRWGAIVHVKLVTGADAIGVEAAKSHGAKVAGLGRYLAKLEQSVKTGRRCSFSIKYTDRDAARAATKDSRSRPGWPELPPPEPPPERVGEIDWTRIWRRDHVVARDKFEVERKLGEWRMVQGWSQIHGHSIGEWARVPHLPGAEECDCFELKGDT